MATTTEIANGNQASTTANLTVTVVAVNDAPVANDASFTVDEDGSVRIDIAKLVSDIDSNVLTLSIANPNHGTLTRNADGTYTYTPRRGYSGMDGFSYSVSDGSLTTTGWIAVKVLRDEDEGYHDHHGACIVVRSTDPNAAPVSIDWTGSAGSNFMGLPVNQADWLPQFQGIPQLDTRSLAEITGLVVRV